MLPDEQLQRIRQLVAKYEALSPIDRRRYQETEVRTNFIDLLFAAIGWDMDDREQVERETSVIEGKRPDYIFKLDGVPHLFLEAKRFTEDVRAEQWARDAITKAYNKGVGWAAVTNFTDLVVYDSYQLLPAGQPPRTVIDLTRDRYADPASLMHELSPASLRDRLVEKRAQEEGIRTRVIPIEKRLYESMRGWRESLFNALYQIKQWKTEAEFSQGDEAIQRLIDRLLFLRNCEDRGIAGTDLRGLRNRIRARDRTVRVTEWLLRLFGQAASTYDSELFDTHANIDVLLRGTGTVLDDTLGQIIEGLYAVPQSYSEYDFSQMEPDVLGEVYEQYLGYVPQRVRSLAAQVPLPGMPAQEITLEAKRQRRKEHGIYYTPRWVVQYIVQQTLGRFLEEHPDRPDDIDNLTILDPACGSGSFLIRAYETLLEHHAAGMGGDIGHMDKRTRERILRRNIYGVDLDPQAVEIARLNLLIRMVRHQERLPELKDNIQHGNSLIEGDQAVLRPFFGDGWEEKHPFNWAQRFPKVMERGGFDIIIGNPPYVRIQTLPRDEVGYYNEKYEAATGSYDIYALFVERGLHLLRPGGLLGFIIPNKFMQAAYGKGLRSVLSDGNAVSKIVDFGDAQIFETGTNYTCLLFLKSEGVRTPVYIPPAVTSASQPIQPQVAQIESQPAVQIAASSLGSAPWSFSPDKESQTLERMEGGNPPLGEVAHLFVGLQTSADKVYIVRLLSRSGLAVTVFSRATGRQHEIEAEFLHPLLKGSLHMRRWLIEPSGMLVVFPYDVTGDRYDLVTDGALQARSPHLWRYLLDNRAQLEGRENGRMRGVEWYAYVYPKNLARFHRPKLLTPSIAQVASFSYDTSGEYYFVGSGGGGGGGYGLTLSAEYQISPYYLLGLLNSRALDFYLQRRIKSSRFHGGYWSYNRQYIARLPIHVPGAGRRPKALHQQLDALARRMLDLHQRLAAKGEVEDNEREQIDREIAITDRQIDDLVYDLYGLTAKERALVESEVRRP
ncbi:MAG: N-6 DNA methylase [Dehalococcoidia bacterium]|nr:N-6 DNA methylase [Dehalococcoidia bacterium]